MTRRGFAGWLLATMGYVTLAAWRGCPQSHSQEKDIIEVEEKESPASPAAAEEKDDVIMRSGIVLGSSWEDCARKAIFGFPKVTPGYIRVQSKLVVFMRPGGTVWEAIWSFMDSRPTR